MNIKKRKQQQQQRNSKRSTRVERSASLSASVTGLTASWPGGYSDGPAAVSTDRSCGDLAEPNCHVVLNRPLRRPHSSASFWDPDGRRRCPVCHSASSLYGSGYSCNVRLFPVDDNRAVSELAVVAPWTKPMSTNNCTWPTRPMLS